MAPVELIRFPDIESLSDRFHQYPEYARTFTKGKSTETSFTFWIGDMVYKPLAVRAALIRCYLLAYFCSASVAGFYSALDKVPVSTSFSHLWKRIRSPPHYDKQGGINSHE